MISGIIKVELSAEAGTLIIPDITKTESNNCFIIHCYKETDPLRALSLVDRCV